MGRLLDWVRDTWQAGSVLVGIALATGAVVAAIARVLGWPLTVVFLIGWCLILAPLVPRLWARLVPGLILECESGEPYDDPRFDLRGQLVLMLNLASGNRAPYDFAKKVRVRARATPLTIRSVWLADSPLGTRMELGWFPDGTTGERVIHPAEHNHYLLFPTGLFERGSGTLRFEVIREDRMTSVSYTGSFELTGRTSFPALRVD